MTEIWRDVLGYEGFYQVSSLGRVRSLDRKVRTSRGNSTAIRKGKILAQNPGGTSVYLLVGLRIAPNSEHPTVHSLVARAFPEICGEWFEGCCVDHINTIKTDNRAENLRVCTYSDNNLNPITLERNKAAQHSKKVEQLTLNGEHIAYYPSVREASRVTNIARPSIRDVLNHSTRNGKKHLTAGGYIWRYA